MEAPWFSNLLVPCSRKCIQSHSGCNIDVLWDEKIAATRACSRNGTTDLEVHLEIYALREEIFTYEIKKMFNTLINKVG